MQIEVAWVRAGFGKLLQFLSSIGQFAGTPQVQSFAVQLSLGSGRGVGIGGCFALSTELFNLPPQITLNGFKGGVYGAAGAAGCFECSTRLKSASGDLFNPAAAIPRK